MMPRRVAPLLVIIGLALGACSRHEAPQKLLAQAQALEQQGKYNGAIIELKNLLQQQPRSPIGRFLLGKIYFDTLNYAAAAKELERARDLGYDAQAVTPLLMRAWLGAGDFQRILDEPEPDPRSALYPALAAARAQAYLAQGKRIEAEQLLDQAQGAYPNNPELHLARARALLLEAKPADALQQADQALAQDPKMVDALLLKADTLRAQGQMQAARQAYEAVLAINPHHYDARLALARLALAQGQTAQARQWVDQVLKDSPGNLQAGYTQALIDYQSGAVKEARDALAPVLKGAPDFAPALLLSGAVEFNLGNLQQAETQLGKVLAANPGNSFARRLLAAAQLRLGEVDDAHGTLMPLNPDTSQDPAVLTLAGEIALARSKPDEAVGYFQRASKLAPDNAGVLTDLGLARLGAGNEAGVADLQSAASMDKDNPRPDLLLTLNYLKHSQYDQALAAIAVWLKKQPHDAAAWNLQGSAYLGKKDSAAARKSFHQALAQDPKYFPAAANLAQIDLAQGQPQAARQQFEALLKADPGNLPAMLSLAQLALAQKQDAEYLGWLDKAAAAHPNAPQPRLLKAAYYLGQGNTAEALVHAREAHDLQPSNPAALELLGRVQIAAGEKANGLDSFRKLADVQPKSANVQLLLAHAYDLNGDQNEALKHLQQAAQLSGKAPVLQAALAEQYIKMQRYDDAFASARALGSTPTEQSLAAFLEGDIAYARKDYTAAIASYRRAQALKPNSPAILRLYRAQTAAGDTAQGIATLDSWAKTHPEDQEIANALAQAYMKNGQYPSAALTYQQLAVRSPNDVALLNNLAWALAQSGDPHAVQYAQRAYKLQPDNPSVLDTYGWALVQNRQAAQGLPYLRQAQTKQPDSADIQWHVAYALYASGDSPRAREELKALFDRRVSFGEEAQARALYQKITRAP